jgi:hypothetical protein
MNMTDDAPAPTSSTATQKAKLLWTTPRVVLLASELGTQGKPNGNPTEPSIYSTTAGTTYIYPSGPS